MLRWTNGRGGNGGDTGAEPDVAIAKNRNLRVVAHAQHLPAEPPSGTAVSNEAHAPVLPGEILGVADQRTGYRAIVGILQRRFEELLAAGSMRTGRLTVETFHRFGPVTLGPMLGVLGLKLIAVVDDEALEALRGRRTPAKFKRWSTSDAGASIPARTIRRNPGSFRNYGHAKSARAKQVAMMTPKQRRRAAKHAAVIRWAAVRKAAGAPDGSGVAADKPHATGHKRFTARAVARPSATAAAASAHAMMAKA
jgi:hypothetical protein